MKAFDIQYIVTLKYLLNFGPVNDKKFTSYVGSAKAVYNVYRTIPLKIRELEMVVYRPGKDDSLFQASCPI